MVEHAYMRPFIWLAHFDGDAKPSGVEVEMSRIEALPFPADVRFTIVRAFTSRLSLAVPITAVSTQDRKKKRRSASACTRVEADSVAVYG